MASKPETRYIASVHKQMPPGIHKEKMNNPFSGGTADVWYSGTAADLWVEYKFIEKIPRSLHILPAVSPLQEKWLRERFHEGRNVAVVLGVPKGGVIYRALDWMVPRTSDELLARVVPVADIAQWIAADTGAFTCPQYLSPLLSPPSRLRHTALSRPLS